MSKYYLMDEQIATTAINQMGGIGALKAFVGANKFAISKEEGFVCFHFKGSRKVNMFKLYYDRGADMYDVEFGQFIDNWKSKNFGYNTVSKHEGIFADMLVELFERETKLYLHF